MHKVGFTMITLTKQMSMTFYYVDDKHLNNSHRELLIDEHY